MRKVRKLVKSARRLVIAVVLLVVALIVGIILLSGRVARSTIEKAGTKAFRTAVAIQKTRVSVLGGSLRLDGLTIDNPAGYKQKTFLQLQRGDMQINMAGLVGKELTITDLACDGLNVILEPSGTGSNLQEIIESLRQAPPFGKRLYVDHLKITNITVTMALVPSAGQAGLVPVKLAPIEMTDLGRDEVLTASKLAYKILTALAANLTKPNGVSLPNHEGNGVLGAFINLGKTVLGAKDPNNPTR